MVARRTVEVLVLIVGAYVIALLPGLLWRPYFDSPAGYLVIVPLFSVFMLHSVGVPGVLEHGGACGWGLCSPTVTGWVVIAAGWLGLAGLLAWGIARLTTRAARRRARPRADAR